MQKTQAVASLGQHRLMLPAWVKAALSANDRLKVYLAVLQSAASHAAYPPPTLIAMCPICRGRIRRPA